MVRTRMQRLVDMCEKPSFLLATVAPHLVAPHLLHAALFSLRSILACLLRSFSNRFCLNCVAIPANFGLPLNEIVKARSLQCGCWSRSSQILIWILLWIFGWIFSSCFLLGKRSPKIHQNKPAKFTQGSEKGVFWKRGLFREIHFLEILEKSKIPKILENLQTLENKGESYHFLEILENPKILEILETPDPFRNDPFFCPKNPPKQARKIHPGTCPGKFASDLCRSLFSGCRKRACNKRGCFRKRPFVHNSVCSQFLEGLFAILAECSQFCLRSF